MATNPREVGRVPTCDASMLSVFNRRSQKECVFHLRFPPPLSVSDLQPSASSFFIVNPNFIPFLSKPPNFPTLPRELQPTPKSKIAAFFSSSSKSSTSRSSSTSERREFWQGLMGNCLDSSAKVDAAQSSRTTSGFSKTSLSSARSNLSIPSYNEKSNALSLPTPRSEGEILSSPNHKAFTFNELKNATRNFRPDSLLGEGGFGYVYKGWIDEHTFTASKPGSGMVVAVKKLKPEGFQGHKEWLTEVNYLGQLHHRNLVKLIGYCLEGENRLLVYEFMPKGSLENHLFRRGLQPLSWSVRMKVAIGAARGLSFLHNAQSQVIYRDFKASNILLDAEFNAKLSDFGLAKAGPTGDRTHVSTQVMGTHGYAAPEYVATGRLTAKSDVYSFGVVLLELLSGRRAVDKTIAGMEQNLVEWAKPYLGDKRRLFRIMDTKLEGQYPQKGAYMAATLALQCLNSDAKARPPMTQVLATLEQIEAPKNAGRNSQSEHQRSHVPVRKSPAQNRSPLNLTPTASPLPSHWQSPRVH